MNSKQLEKYAALLVESGVNLQKNQELFVRCFIDAAPLARAVVKAAYIRGARKVFVCYEDGASRRLDYQYQSADVLCDIPAFIPARANAIPERNAAVVSIVSEDPDIYAGLDAGKIGAYEKSSRALIKPYYEAAMKNQIRWCVCAYPSLPWAKKVFPSLTSGAAFKKLGDYILKAARADLKNPVLAWKNHSARLHAICEKLNKADIDYFHYTNKLGTDLKVKMPVGYIFTGGSEESLDGTPFNANIPSEEVFSAPHKYGTDGVLYSTMPLVYCGNTIEGIRLVFKNGRVTEYSAKSGEQLLKEILDADEGARHLGEIALVEYDSPISNLNTVFYQTLFDENASCHFALGKAYASCIEGGADMDKERLDKAGVNDSIIHEDFMIGSRDLSITAKTRDGKDLVIFKDGNFVKD